MKKNQILGQVGLYTAATVLAQAVTLATSILTRRFLGPVQTGVWAMLQVILQYTTHSQLGTVKAALREIPHFVGRGEPERADDVKNNAMSFTILSSSVAAACVALFALAARGSLRREVFIGLFFIAALVVLQRVHNLMIGLLRAYKNFSLAGRQVILSAVLNAAFIVVFTYYFKIYGFMIAMCVSFAANMAYMAGSHPYRFRWAFDRPTIRALLAFGLPLIALNVLVTVFQSIDKVLIASFLGFAEMGRYSIAAMAYEYLVTFPAAVGIVLAPHLQERLGRVEAALADDVRGDMLTAELPCSKMSPRMSSDVRDYVTRSSAAFADTMPLLVGAAWFAGPVVIAVLLPEFRGAVPALRFLALGSFFLALTQNYETFLIGAKRHLSLFPVFLGASLLALTLNVAVIRRGLGIEGVAAVTAFAVFLRFTFSFVNAARFLYEKRRAAACYASLVGRFAIMVGVLAVLGAAGGRGESLGKAALRMGAMAFFYAPALWKIGRELGVAAMLREKLFSERACAKSNASKN